MNVRESLTLNQREKRLIKAIQEMEILNSGKDLIQSYQEQLGTVQEEIKRETLRLSSLVTNGTMILIGKFLKS